MEIVRDQSSGESGNQIILIKNFLFNKTDVCFVFLPKVETGVC